MESHPEQLDIELAQRGDKEAYGRLVRNHMTAIERVAGAIVGDPQGVSDVVQETFIKAYHSLPSLREKPKFKQWLFGIARSASLDYLRSRRREINLTDLSDIDFDRLETTAPAAHGEVESDTRRRVVKAIEALPETYREILTMKYLSGLSYEDLGRALNLSVSAVESKLFRARLLLKEKLERLD